MEQLRKIWVRLQALRFDERGFVTAEHLGVAALAMVALVVIIGAMQALGLDIVDGIATQITDFGSDGP